MQSDSVDAKCNQLLTTVIVTVCLRVTIVFNLNGISTKFDEQVQYFMSSSCSQSRGEQEYTELDKLNRKIQK